MRADLETDTVKETFLMQPSGKVEHSVRLGVDPLNIKVILFHRVRVNNARFGTQRTI